MLKEGIEGNYALTDQLVIHFLEIPKIEDREMSSKIMKWLLYLRAEGQDNKMIKILLENDEDLQAAHTMYKAFTNDEKLRRYALGREMAERDRLQQLSDAKKDGLEEGLEKGLSEGLVEGKLKEKHHILIRQLELKYTLSEDETELILSITDNSKLDAALEAFVFSENKEGVLEILQKDKE